MNPFRLNEKDFLPTDYQGRVSQNLSKRVNIRLRLDKKVNIPSLELFLFFLALRALTGYNM